MMVEEFVAIVLEVFALLRIFLTKYEKVWMIMISKFFMADVLLQIVIFNALNIVFSFGFHMLYFN